MEDLPARGPTRPRPPETLLPLPPGRLLLSRWCRLSRSSSPMVLITQLIFTLRFSFRWVRQLEVCTLGREHKLLCFYF